MDQGIGNWPSLHALRKPRQVALIDAQTHREFTFEELDSRTSALAESLGERGISKGDRVALVTLNSPHMIEVLLAIAKLGAVSVPVNFRLTPPEVQYILADSGAEIVFTSPQTTETVQAALDGTGVRDAIEIPSAADRADLVDSEFERLVAAGTSERVVTEVASDDLCMLMYTSGTTGFPKGAKLTHGNMLWNAINNLTVGEEGSGPSDVAITAAPLFHIGALGIFTLPFLYAGGTSVILEAFSPEGWLDAVETFKPSVAFCVPAMWAALDAAESIDERDLSSLRYVLSGGAPCPLVLIESMRARGLEFLEGFGLTETAPIVSVLNASDVVEHAGSVGKPALHVEMRVVDESGEDAEQGEIGELAVRGPNVFVGYWNLPEATAVALRGGWFMTGDLAREDAEGFFSIIDRKKDMIISGGENVYATEVEQAIYRHSAVAEVAVVGRPDERWGEAVAAVVVIKPGESVSEEELISWLRERLAGFKCPRTVIFMDALPRNATGKILKRELRRKWVGGGATVQR